MVLPIFTEKVDWLMVTTGKSRQNLKKRKILKFEALIFLTMTRYE
jgi:hypothetical protein